MEIELKPIRTMEKSVLEKDKVVIGSMERSILLIGPSQNGKSALATFLFNGRALKGTENSVFPEGNGTHSFTDKWNSLNVTWCCNKVSYILKIIDTPGTGDTDEEKEQSRMMDVYDQLSLMKNSRRRINTIVMVVKYPYLLTRDLENNLKYYRKMIPEASNKNIILILTHVEVSESWRQRQMIGGRPDPQEEIKNFLDELSKIMDIDFNLTYETIDSHCLPDTDEERHGLEVRERIFKACIKSEGVNLDSLRLPKTKLLLNQCQSIKDKLKGKQLQAIKYRNEEHELVKQQTNLIKDLESELHEEQSKLKQKQTEVSDLDNKPEYIQIYEEHFTGPCNIFPCINSQSQFDIAVKYPIRKISCGSTSYKDIQKSEDLKKIRGTLESKFKVNCQVRLSTSKEDMFGQQIATVKTEINSLEKAYSLVHQKLALVSDENNNTKMKIESLNHQISDFDKEINHYSSEFISLVEYESWVAHGMKLSD